MLLGGPITRNTLYTAAHYFDIIYSLREKKKISIDSQTIHCDAVFFGEGGWLIRCKLSDEVEEYLLCSSQFHKQGKATSKHTLHELPDALAQLSWWPRCGEGQEMARRVCTTCVAKSCAKVELNGEKICCRVPGGVEYAVQLAVHS